MGIPGGNAKSIGPDEQWRRVQARLQAKLGAPAYTSWFGRVRLHSVEDGVVRIGAPTKFVRDWIVSHYAEMLATFWNEEDTSITRLEVIFGEAALDPAPAEPASERQSSAPGTGAAPAPAKPAARRERRTIPSPFSDTERSLDDFDLESIGSPLDTRFTFDAFVVGKSNDLAYAAARRVAEASDVTFNPLYLYGGVGLGKTHLMHAIAWEIREKHPERRVIHLSAERFFLQFVDALRFQNTMAFKHMFRNVDVLMVDDFQFIANKASTQEEFFHTFNALTDHQRQIIICADRSPADLEGIEERIRSRLGWGMVANVEPTDFELRLGIIQMKADEILAHSGDVEIPQTVLEFLAQRIVSNIRELEGALKRVVAYATMGHEPVTVESTQRLLHDLLRSNDKKITIDEIQRCVADFYNVRISDLLSPRRARQVARPRQIAMYLAKQLTTRSLPEIGRKFGGRDHTTVIHAVRKIDELCGSDRTIEEDVERLRRQLTDGSGGIN